MIAIANPALRTSTHNTKSRTHTHTQARTRIHAGMRANKQTCSIAIKNAHVRTNTRAHGHAYTRTHARTHDNGDDDGGGDGNGDAAGGGDGNGDGVDEGDGDADARIVMALAAALAIPTTIWRTYNNFVSEKPYTVERDFKSGCPRSDPNDQRYITWTLLSKE